MTSHTPDVVSRFLEASYSLMLESSPYVLAGLLLGAAVRAYVPRDWIVRHLTGRWSRVKAAVVGIPLPLCSCAVLPLTVAVRETGAGAGAAVSFLVTTPQTDVNSVLLTLALLGPYFTALKIAAAVTAGLLAGILVDRFEGTVPASSGCHDGCGGCCGACGHAGGFLTELLDMSATAGTWMIVGFLAAGAVQALMPAVPGWLAGEPWGPAVMALVSLPLYVCSVAVAPIAAAIVEGGASPGSALSFSVAGPGTNVAVVPLLLKSLGLRTTMIVTSVVLAVAMTFGYLSDALGLPVGRMTVPTLGTWCYASEATLAGFLTLVAAGVAHRAVRRGWNSSS